MDQNAKSLLYRHPHLYEALYPTPDQKTYASPAICNKICHAFLKTGPQSILDIGCGTGRYLNFLSEGCKNCIGVDFLPAMVDFAVSQYDHIDFFQGDMREFRLNRTFDLLICMGSTFLHALTNSDIERTLETFAAHSHRGSLLILDIKNFMGFVDNSVEEKVEKEINTDEFKGKSVTSRTFNRAKQLWIWKRTWYIQDHDPVEDYLEFRMLFPLEIEHYLSQSGFSVIGMFDNLDLEESDFKGERLYIAATYTGKNQSQVLADVQP
ncbi:class I SAM-dependent methyltransferase [Desulfobacula toluolica]|uniref:Putative methyltransferase, type 11 n=1 Tax=Desulfobacula toluolica (strain DSM 7467 / Tol2) TaxID=651182 RepID=K0N4N4_DESTT|nr:class I SAM-dependent methyltransferase [Desulfobacula toluolica]CCK79044.1 putative methyltransferase, type 11 [Desulfobacula toluolica Tol2]